MKKERIFWGLFFIVAAIFLLVSRLGLLGDIGLWSLLLTVFFVACLVKSIAHKSVSGVLFAVAFLCIVYAKPLGIEAITPWPVLGAAALGSIGISFLYHPRRDYRNYGCWGRGNHYSTETEETVDGSQMEFSTSFAGSIKYVNSDDFQSADLKCSFGSLKVYFDNAMIQNGAARIFLDVSFGGVELFVPKEWNVVNNVSASFGSVDEKNSSRSSGVPVVTLTGKVSFGGIEIVYI